MDNQSLQTFKQFVDFVKNIDQYDKIVENIKAATEAHDKAYANLLDGKSLVASKKELEDTKARLEFERKEFDKVSQEKQKVLDSRTKVLDATESALGQQAGFQKANKELLDEKFAELAKRSADLDKKERDLNDQIEVNNQVAKDLAAKAQRLSEILK